MDLRHLGVLEVIAREGTITGAARRLHTSQPALSQLLRRIESELGFAVFDRTTNPLRLSAAGERFLPRVIEIDRRYAAALAEARGTGPQAALTVGAAPRMARLVFPALLADARELRLERELRLVEASSVELRELIGRRVVDAAVLTAAAVGDGLAFEPVLRSGFLVAARDESADDRETTPIAGSELSGRPLLLPKAGGVRGHLTPFLESLEDRRISIESSSTETLLGLAELGQGVAIVPELVVSAADRQRFPMVRFSPLLDGPPPIVSGIALRAGIALDQAHAPAVGLLRRTLERCFPEAALTGSV